MRGNRKGLRERVDEADEGVDDRDGSDGIDGSHLGSLALRNHLYSKPAIQHGEPENTLATHIRYHN